MGSLKIRFIRGWGGHEKSIYRREFPKNGRGLGQFADLRGGGGWLGKKEGGGEGGDTPMYTANLAITLTVILIY